MYAVAICGSPRKKGNTELLLREVIAELDNAGWETEFVKVGGKPISGCIACQKCFENQDNECAVKKDVFNDIFSKMLRADAVILGSPTYFAAVSADLKALIERAGYVAYATFLSMFPFAIFAVALAGAWLTPEDIDALVGAVFELAPEHIARTIEPARRPFSTTRGRSPATSIARRASGWRWSSSSRCSALPI